MAVLHNFLLIGVVLVLVRHGGAAGPGRAGDGESKPSWIKRLTSLLHSCITTVTLPVACQWTAAADALVKMEA